MLSPFQFRSPLVSGDGSLLDWAQRWFAELTNNVNSAVTTIPGPYANDAAAATAKVQKGKPYYRSDGTVWIRLA